MSALPETIGRFRIDARLDGVLPNGRRAFSGRGHLCAATDLETAHTVTLRVFNETSQAWHADFSRHTERLTHLSHPHLVRVLAGGTDGDRAWWVFDHGVPSTLGDFLARNSLPPLHVRMAIIADICRAVAYARGRGVADIDIGPGWLWLRPDGQSCAVAGFEPPAGGSFEQFAAGVDALERLRYATPEVVVGTTRDARTLVFLLGIVLYECVTGRQLFDGDRPLDVARQVLHASPSPVIVRSDGAPVASSVKGGIEALLLRALAKAPADRFTSVDEFADALDHIVRELRRSDEASAGARDPAMLPPHAAQAPAPAPAMPLPRSPLSPGPTPPLPIYDEHVQFTVYRPRALTPDAWETMLVFAHLDALPWDAPSGTPDPVEEVQRQARALLGDTSAHGQQRVDSGQPVPREGLVVVVPQADGIDFNPPTAAFLWVEAVHREEFRVRPRPAVVGQTVRGRVTVFLGSIILAEIPLTFTVGPRRAAALSAPIRERARPYRRIFASYSHRDQPIVEEFSRYAEALGDQYLRDVVQLRSGEHWSDGLKELIRQADVFQLFWSWHAMRSPYVREEWQYALGLQRASFIRPVYWDDPLPAADDQPPESLRALHFERIHPVAVGHAGGTREAGPPPVEADERRVVRPKRLARVARFGGPILAAVIVAFLLVPLVDRTDLQWSGRPSDAIRSDARDPATERSVDIAPTVPPDSPVVVDRPPPTPTESRPAKSRPPAAKTRPSRPSATVPASPAPPAVSQPEPSGEMQRTRSVVVVVRNAQDAPLADVRVLLRPTAGTGPRMQITTDAEGRGTVRVRRETTYEVVLSHEDFGSTTRTLAAGTSPATLTVTLSAPGGNEPGV